MFCVILVIAVLYLHGGGHIGVCISLITNELIYLIFIYKIINEKIYLFFVYLLAVSITGFVKCLILYPFSLVLLTSFVIDLYEFFTFLACKPFVRYINAFIFSNSVTCLFFSLMEFFEE